MSLHPTAASGFQGEIYERGRADYPGAAITSLALTPQRVVADLGCGTGKLTRQLVEAGARVVGIEPLLEMRQTFSQLLPGVPLLAGTAEAIPLRDETVDLVTCASAFHWFDHAAAIPEIHRVLKPHGRLAIIWNRRDELTGWAGEFFRITEAYRRGTPGYLSGAWRVALEGSGLFGPITEQRFDHAQRTDRDGLVARVESISFIATLPHDERRRVLDDVGSFLDSHPDLAGREVIEVPYRTTLYVTEALTAA